MAFRIKPNILQGKINYQPPKIVGEVRKSQSITNYGPGALCDFPRLSGIISGIDNWVNTLGKFKFDKMKIHERNLERILGKKFFVQPQMIEDNSDYVYGISVERFPTYYYCPVCGVLDKYYRIEKKSNNSTKYNREITCALCYQTNNRIVRLIPSRFVVACDCGHIDDFPYEWWVHRNKGRCESPKLSIEISNTTNSLEGIVIKCKCGASENLEGIMDRGALHQLKCYGWMPWLGKSEDSRSWYSECTKEFPCGEELRVLQRGANNVYYPQIVSALTIPPYSSRIQRLLASDIVALEDYSSMPENLKKENLSYYYEKNKDQLRCSWVQFVNELEKALGLFENGYSDFNALKFGEYSALCDEDCTDPDFWTFESEIAPEIKRYVDQVKIVGRLREVEVLTGFKRISHESEGLAPLSRKPLEWLPGNELYGEGIFIRFNETRIKIWEKKNTERYKTLVKRAKKSGLTKNRISEDNVRYVLLHTVAHLLIRELTLRCGYTTAALKEKVYSSEKDGEAMCGILIYTASSDSDGSLGGLARQGIKEKLRDLFLNMLESASWCSNDPICIDSKSQGVAALNIAACYSCTLLPETSCECSNLLLDRCALVGTSDKPSLGFFEDLIHD